MTGSLRILEAGWSTTIQDLGRHGFAHLGVATAGAVDAGDHGLANRLVGNDERAATIETAGGLVIEAIGAIVAATSGDGNRHTLRPGDRLRVDTPDDAMWSYLAVRGGIAVEPVLGSRSRDTMSGLGPPAIAPGGELRVGDDPQTAIAADLAPVRQRSRRVRLWPGPRVDWFAGGLDALVGREWTVGSDVSRVGVRLSPGAFEPTSAMPDHMASEGLVVGAIQITPAGEPIVMLANHPTTGGYPVIAVVDPDDLAAIAQSRPGTTLRFVPA